MSRNDTPWLVQKRRDRRKQKRRRAAKGRAVWSWGTRPTPSDPGPSNMVTKTYRDGTCDIRTPPASDKVVAEYKIAIAEWPDNAELRMEFAFSLSLARRRDEATAHARVAAKLRPEWDWPRRFLSGREPGSPERGADGKS